MFEATITVGNCKRHEHISLHRRTPRAWLDCIWLASYVVWGAAALDVSTANAPLRDRRKVPRLTTRRIVLLGAALLAVPVAALVESVQGHHVHVWVEAAGASVIAILVLVRLSGLVRAVEAARADERVARHAAEEMQLRLAAQNEQLLELDRLKDEFVWSASQGMTDLGPNGVSSGALAVSDTGLVLGSNFTTNRASLWYVGPPWGYWERNTGFGGSRCSWNHNI